LVQGLTIDRLVRYLRLDQPPLSDQLAKLEGLIAAKKYALDRIPELQSGGLFSARIADSLHSRCDLGLVEQQEELANLKKAEADKATEYRLLMLRCFGAEKTHYFDMFTQGHLSERVYRGLLHTVEDLIDHVRYERPLPASSFELTRPAVMQGQLFRLLIRLPFVGLIKEKLQADRAAMDYEEMWGRYQGASDLLDHLDEICQHEAIHEDVIDKVRKHYKQWQAKAREHLDNIAAQFPEFVTDMQTRLAERLFIHAERSAVIEQVKTGMLPKGVGEVMLQELASRERSFRQRRPSRLKLDPSELLQKVDFFKDIPEEEFKQITQHLRSRIIPAGDVIIQEGEIGDSLFLIMRGVVRVSHTQAGKEVDLATLFAGDFFGEMALLHGQPRVATCRAVTPCALSELSRADCDKVRPLCPAIQAAMEAADKLRR